MAKEAERLLDGTGWLPEPLRLAGSEPAADVGEALPDFLNVEEVEGGGSADADEPLPQVAAA